MTRPWDAPAVLSRSVDLIDGFLTIEWTDGDNTDWRRLCPADCPWWDAVVPADLFDDAAELISEWYENGRYWNDYRAMVRSY